MIVYNDFIYSRFTNKLYKKENNNIQKIKKVERIYKDKLDKIKHRANFNLSLKDIKEKIIRESKHIIFEVTTKCNFSCAYCYFSQNKKNELRYNMNWDIAKKALIYFFNFLVNKVKKNDDVFIGFFGGEPLINFELIKKIVEWTEKYQKNQKIHFTITSNGSLLNKNNIAFLVEKGFKLVISLDGPRDEHNKYRIYKNGEGTFDDVWVKIRNLRKKYPEYFIKNVSFAAVSGANHNLISINKFFNKKIFNRKNIIANEINMDLISDKFIRREKKLYYQYFEDLKNVYNNCLINKNASIYLKNLINSKYIYKLGEKRFNLLNIIEIVGTNGFSVDSPLIPANCFPLAERFFVSVNGNIYFCERIFYTYRIGNIYGGVDFKKIYELLIFYFKKIFFKCLECEFIQLCPACWTSMLNRNNNICNNSLKIVKNYIKYYMEMFYE